MLPAGEYSRFKCFYPPFESRSYIMHEAGIIITNGVILIVSGRLNSNTCRTLYSRLIVIRASVLTVQLYMIYASVLNRKLKLLLLLLLSLNVFRSRSVNIILQTDASEFYLFSLSAD